MSFKEQLDEDLNLFFNDDEFAEMHNIGGKDIIIIPDEDLLKEKKIKSAEGTYFGSLLFSVKKKDLDFEPEINMRIQYDGKPKYITDCQKDIGVYIITLGENMS